MLRSYKDFDNCSSLTLEVFQNYVSQKGIEYVRSPACHPRSNGQAERIVGIKKKMLRRASGSVEQRLRYVVLRYRDTPRPAVSLNGSLNN